MEKEDKQRARHEGNEPKAITEAGGLTDYMERAKCGISITDKEAALLLGYMEGHGYVIGEKGGKLYRGDLCNTPGKIIWESEEYTPDDVIDTACEWNYEMMNREAIELENPFLENGEKEGMEKHLGSLKADKVILDRLFDLTKYGRQIEEKAQDIAARLVDAVTRSDNLDGVVAVVGEDIRQYASGGRSR